MSTLRLCAWSACLTISVYISNQDVFIRTFRSLLEEYTVSTWLFLLPISLTLSWWIAQVVFYIIGFPRISPEKKAVFITGCDSGFGFWLALRLSSYGFKVFAGCLFPNGEGAQDLKRKTCTQQGEGRIIIVACDVTLDQSLTKAVDVVTRNLSDGEVLWAVVANAGVGKYGYLEWISIEDMKSLFDVNVFGFVRTFKAFAPSLRKCKGRLVVTNSFASRFSPPTLVAYSMSKYASLAMCDGLRAELAPFGVHVASIEPNMYRTSIIPSTTKDLDAQWESLCEEQQYCYGKKLLKQSRIMVQDFAYLCQDNLTLPLSCFEHAIVAKYPKDSYQCDRLSMWFLQKVVICLPYEFISFFHKYIHWLLILGRKILPGRYSP